jgi:hypothetical protein
MSPILNIAISVTISIFLGYYFYFKSKNVKKLVFHFSRTCLQPITHPDIVINYKENKITSLNRLVLLIYNNGNVEIRSSDIPENKFPKIYFMEGVKLLSYNLLEKSNDNIAINMNQTDDGDLITEFNYLNPRDGFVVEVFYDSIKELERPFKFRSPIIGGGFQIFDSKLNYMKYIFLTLPFMMLAVLRSPLPLDPNVRKRVLEQISNRPEWIFILEYTSVGIMTLISIILFIKMSKQSIIPKFSKKYFKIKSETHSQLLNTDE